MLNLFFCDYGSSLVPFQAVVPSKREFDIRAPWYLEELERGGPLEFVEEQADALQGQSFGTAGGLIVNDDRDMTWERTIPWLRSVTKLPIVLKGELRRVGCDIWLIFATRHSVR